MADHGDFPAIYIDGTTGGVGSEADPLTDFASINWTTGGDNSVCDAVAANKDVTITLQKGVTWREQMTVGTSGSAAHPIIIQAYGEGADPIINGADVLTTWTQSGETVTPSPLANSDDGFVKKTAETIDLTNSHVWMGMGTEHMSSFFRFVLNVPQGATIATAKITLHCQNSRTDGCVVDIYADDHDDSPQLTDFASWTTAIDRKTAASANWDFPATTSGENYDSSEIKTVIQEIVDRGSWSSGNYIQLLLDDTVSTNEFDAEAIDDGGGNPAILTVTYGNPDAYDKAGITTEPEQVVYDGTVLTENDGATTGVGNNEWDWAADTLYVNVGEDPDTGVLEASVRNEGIYGNDKDYIIIQNIEFKYHESAGITLVKGDYATIDSITSSYTDGQGINISEGSNVTITNNTIHHTLPADTSHRQGIYLEESDDCVISGNDISYCWDGIRILNGSGAGSGSTGNIIENNTLHNNYDHGIDIGQNGTDDNIIRYNEIYDNSDGGIKILPDSSGNKIYYNVVYGNTNEQLLDEGINSEWYNNIADSTGVGVNSPYPVGLYLTKDCTNITVKNNIFLNNQYHVLKDSLASIASMDYNCFYPDTGQKFHHDGSTYNFADWKTNSGQDTHSMAVDPLMTDPGSDDFTLQVGSPCINAGTDVGLTEDYAGNSVLAIPDIGAYEHQGAEAAPSQGSGLHLGMGMGMT